MTTKPEVPAVPENLQTSASTNETNSGKKPFVEPELSEPVDVLEATTFFQVASSGVATP